MSCPDPRALDGSAALGLGLLALAIALATGCDPAPESALTPAHGAGPIAEVHVHKCSACHTLPEPGTRTHAYLEGALSRHRKRVRLDDDQWQAMVDYLSRRD